MKAAAYLQKPNQPPPKQQAHDDQIPWQQKENEQTMLTDPWHIQQYQMKAAAINAKAWFSKHDEGCCQFAQA